MTQHGKHPEQPEVNDPPPAETAGIRGDKVEKLPVDGVPVDTPEEDGTEMPID